MGNNYPNMEEQNPKKENEEVISFPTDADYKVFRPVEEEGPLSPFSAEYIDKQPLPREVLRPSDYPRKKSNSIIVVLLSAVLTLLVVLLIVVIVISNMNKGNHEETVSDTVVTSNEEISTVTFDRYTTYSSGFTYTDMPGIHYSTESSDEKSLEMVDFIKTFNDAWIEYVNYNNTTVYTYLREGTKPYQYAVSFGQKDLTEEYQVMKVNDVREYNGTYYVWTYEVINKYSKGKTEQAIYNWVYEIRKDASGYYVQLYKKDPYYK